MTVIVRRSDCQCGGISGLFFGRIEISRVVAPEEVDTPGSIAEVHYPFGRGMHCEFFLNGRVLSTERAATMILNNAAARVDAPRVGYMDHEGLTGSRAAEAIERYSALPDNP